MKPTRFALKACVAFGVALGITPTQARPDLTGVWFVPMQVHAAGVPMQSDSLPWAPASNGDPRRKHIPNMAEVKTQTDAMFNGTAWKPGVLALHLGPTTPPAATSAGLAAAAKFDSKLDLKHDLDCYPYNVFQRLAGGLGAMQIVQSLNVMVIGTEINGNNFPRVIWLDKRSAENELPSYEGFSTGRWDGDTLHVETVKIKGGYFGRGWPLSDDAVLLEDFRIVKRRGKKELEILQTLRDPHFYTEPLMRVSYAEWRPDLELHDFPCEEGKEDQIEVQRDK
jgi:hypothetical protein